MHNEFLNYPKQIAEQEKSSIKKKFSSRTPLKSGKK